MSTPIITPQGYQKLQDELDRLWRIERREIVQAVSEAAALGDRSENAEYIYGKKRLREIDRRIRYLQKRLPDLKVVERAPDTDDTIYFAATVTLIAEDDEQTRTIRIVGPDEIDPQKMWISIDSPVARRLIGQSVGQIVTLPDADRGPRKWEIVEVYYQI